MVGKPRGHTGRPWRVALSNWRTGPACSLTQRGRGLQSPEPQTTSWTWEEAAHSRGLSRGLLMADSRFSLGVPLQLPTLRTSPVPRSRGPQPDLGSRAVCTGLGSASPPTKPHLPGPEGVDPGQSIQRRWASLGSAGSERGGLALHPFSEGWEWA